MHWPPQELAACPAADSGLTVDRMAKRPPSKDKPNLGPMLPHTAVASLAAPCAMELRDPLNLHDLPRQSNLIIQVFEGQAGFSLALKREG